MRQYRLLWMIFEKYEVSPYNFSLKENAILPDIARKQWDSFSKVERKRFPAFFICARIQLIRRLFAFQTYFLFLSSNALRNKEEEIFSLLAKKEKDYGRDEEEKGRDKIGDEVVAIAVSGYLLLVLVVDEVFIGTDGSLSHGKEDRCHAIESQIEAAKVVSKGTEADKEKDAERNEAAVAGVYQCAVGRKIHAKEDTQSDEDGKGNAEEKLRHRAVQEIKTFHSD